MPRLAASGCRWRENGRGLGQLLLPGPSPPSSLLRQAEGLPDPSFRLSLGWLPCTQGPQRVKVGGGSQAPFGGPFADLSISLLPFCSVPRNGG